MDYCIFCGVSLNPGGNEHVFPASLGGRIVTKKATCPKCNNDFSVESNGNVDSELADNFLFFRCALSIWSRRNQPPPTILKAGVYNGNIEYDLAPGLIPVTRPGKVPKILSTGESGSFVASNEKDAQRILEILKAQGANIEVTSAKIVQKKAPESKHRISINGPLVFRAISKMVLVAGCVLYGNQTVRSNTSKDLRTAAFIGSPNISDFAGWDFTNEWVSDIIFSPYNTGASIKDLVSGLEHSIYFCDVGNDWVAYVNLFGDLRFSVWLGPSTGLPQKGIAINPRLGANSRLIMAAKSPATYIRRTVDSFKNEHLTILSNVELALTKVMAYWQSESRKELYKYYADQLVKEVCEKESDLERNQAIQSWALRFTTIELGEEWEQTLDDIELD